MKVYGSLVGQTLMRESGPQVEHTSWRIGSAQFVALHCCANSYSARLLVAFFSCTDGTPGQITLNGKVVMFPPGQDPDHWFVDWMHVYPPKLTKGEPVWVSFHTRYWTHPCSEAQIAFAAAVPLNILLQLLVCIF